MWHALIFEAVLFSSDISPHEVPRLTGEDKKFHTNFRGTKNWENLFTLQIDSPKNLFKLKYLMILMKYLVQNARASFNESDDNSVKFLCENLFLLPREIFKIIICYL